MSRLPGSKELVCGKLHCCSCSACFRFYTERSFTSRPAPAAPASHSRNEDDHFEHRYTRTRRWSGAGLVEHFNKRLSCRALITTERLRQVSMSPRQRLKPPTLTRIIASHMDNK